jgi:hypothetical protein
MRANETRGTKTEDETMNAAKQIEISRRILEQVAAGMNVRDALDAVCGEGSAARLIDSLYSELRAA